MQLIVNYYKDKSPERQKEIDYCLQYNIDSKLFTEIIIVINPFERPEINDPDKITRLYPIMHRRPTYTDFFIIASKYGEGIKIVANADIYFDETIKLAKQIKTKQVFALSRWDVDNNGQLKHHEHRDSQDVWIFRDRVNINVNYGLGQPGCDNAIAYEFSQAGFTVINPSKTIRCIHLHLSYIKSYCDEMGELLPGITRVPQPYLRIEPSEL
jgi:hypothetical protein